MAITVASIVTNFDTFFGDATTDRVSQAERFQYITEATTWLQESLGNDHQNVSYDIDYLDTVNYYKITATVPDLESVVDLRRAEGLNYPSFTYKSPRELAEEIATENTDPSYTIERRDGQSYLGINYFPSNLAYTVFSFESTTGDGGTWAVDATTSDATNLTIDTLEKKEGNASFNFDITVAQSVNNRATIQNSTITSKNLSDWENLGTWVGWIYVLDVTFFSSLTMYWGSSTSNYWSATTTTTIDGGAFVNGWNRVKIVWANATKTGTPVSTAITYGRFDFNYTASQGNTTDYRIDDFKLVVPERLKLHYTSWNVGTSTGGTDITAFTATTDIPFFSGQYDNYKYAVAHKACSLAFYATRQRDEALSEATEAERDFRRQQKIFPKSVVTVTKSFKPQGLNFRRKRF